MSRAALIFGLVSCVLCLVAHALVLRYVAPVESLSRVVISALATSAVSSFITLGLCFIAYFFPSGKDLDRLAREMALREANRVEKEEWLRVRKQEDELRRHEAETRKLQTEALLVQQRYEEDQRRIARNARARERRRQERGLPPEPQAPRPQATRPQAPRPQTPAASSKEPAPSALDAILLDDDDDSV